MDEYRAFLGNLLILGEDTTLGENISMEDFRLRSGNEAARDDVIEFLR